MQADIKMNSEPFQTSDLELFLFLQNNLPWMFDSVLNSAVDINRLYVSWLFTFLKYKPISSTCISMFAVPGKNYFMFYIV